MPTIQLPTGPVDYRVFGPDAGDRPVVVFVHGFLVNGTLWDPVAAQLATGGVRCHRFLKGEDTLLLAWAGPAPAVAGSTRPARRPSRRACS